MIKLTEATDNELVTLANEGHLFFRDRPQDQFLRLFGLNEVSTPSGRWLEDMRYLLRNGHLYSDI